MAERPVEELLNAYLDGELDGADTARVEKMVEADPALQLRLRRLAEAGASVRAAYSEALHEPPPAPLGAAIERAFEMRSASGRGPGWSSERMRLPRYGFATAAIAAALLLVVGLPMTLEMQVERRLAAEREERQAEKQALESAIQKALETNTSGERAAWRAPQQKLAGTVVPVRTFRNTDGRWCREYLQQIDVGSRHGARQGIACRDADGVWRTRLETFLQS